MDHVKPGKSYSAAIGPAADQSTVSKRNATPSVRSTAPQRTQKSVALPVNVSIDAASSSKHPPGPSISAPFSCPSVPAVLRSHDAQLSTYVPRFKLSVRQSPQHGLAVGSDVTAYKNARMTPLDPPPVCELVPESKDDAQYLSSIEASVSACLVSGEEPYKEVASDNKMTDALVGNRFESPSIAPCTKQQDECFFIFTDLGVRKPGRYRLRFDLLDRTDLRLQRVASAFSDPFEVVSEKKQLPGWTTSSDLINAIVRRGLRLRSVTGSMRTQRVSVKKRKVMSDELQHYRKHLSRETASSSRVSAHPAVDMETGAALHPHAAYPPLDSSPDQQPFSRSADPRPSILEPPARSGHTCRSYDGDQHLQPSRSAALRYIEPSRPSELSPNMRLEPGYRQYTSPANVAATLSDKSPPISSRSVPYASPARLPRPSVPHRQSACHAGHTPTWQQLPRYNEPRQHLSPRPTLPPLSSVSPRGYFGHHERFSSASVSPLSTRMLMHNLHLPAARRAAPPRSPSNINRPPDDRTSHAYDGRFLFRAHSSSTSSSSSYVGEEVRMPQRPQRWPSVQQGPTEPQDDPSAESSSSHMDSGEVIHALHSPATQKSGAGVQLALRAPDARFSTAWDAADGQRTRSWIVSGQPRQPDWSPVEERRRQNAEHSQHLQAQRPHPYVQPQQHAWREAMFEATPPTFRLERPPVQRTTLPPIRALANVAGTAERHTDQQRGRTRGFDFERHDPLADVHPSHPQHRRHWMG